MRRTLLLSLAVGLLAGCSPQAAPGVGVNLRGRLEVHDGLRVLRTWGTPAERGYAHGSLLGAEIAAAMRTELVARFGRQPALLERWRQAIGVAVGFPDDMRAELEALHAGLVDSGADLRLVEFQRDIDRNDLLVVNALDVFSLMGCSGFTAHGEQVDGGGVLTARNFDWPLTGAHLADATILLVQHGPDGRAVASVTWPGFVGVVTGINRAGMSAYLHVGSAAPGGQPRAGSWPTAAAARAILETGGPGVDNFAAAERLLGRTSPGAGFLTRIALGTVAADDPPFALFETDVHKVVRGRDATCAVVTNHFVSRDDGREPSRDSLSRTQTLTAGLAERARDGDRRLSPAEAWELLVAVQRDAGSPTVHALVFRHEPWCFELRVAQVVGGKVVAAPASARRHTLTRNQVFAIDRRGR